MVDSVMLPAHALTSGLTLTQSSSVIYTGWIHEDVVVPVGITQVRIICVSGQGGGNGSIAGNIEGGGGGGASAVVRCGSLIASANGGDSWLDTGSKRSLTFVRDDSRMAFSSL